ncbi:type I restriction endonuclease subunit R [[Mycoplasma] testudinis]|uniref:type I restriction endonuclease subunit R n=1 Tax=[Mycoplasma] testudinis TaxID=33924 RepID=UPI0006982EB6|nr:type I restriction endonuclease subunit R [[Mycoplasma] testudinis]
MEELKPIIQSDSFTVVGSYEVKEKNRNALQSEYELELDLIERLQNQGYELVHIQNNDELKLNLRKQLEKLNNIKFSDNEWNFLLRTYLANYSEGIEEKTRKVQEDFSKSMTLDDGSPVNIHLFDKNNIENNTVQVTHQYVTEGTYKNIYDVTILVNGLPLVHIELKKRGVNLKNAFNQIQRYNRFSFWSEDAFFEYTQIYIISNGTLTKYFSNTTRDASIKENENYHRNPNNQTAHSYEFTSYWADAKNNRIEDLEDFAATFLKKQTLLNVLFKYCVFTVDKELLVMRPYQIAATERILEKIESAKNNELFGTKQAGGYVWHTTGSGKTLTSFKTAKLATSKDFISKVIFVVDRRDLDYQTMKEYEKFEKGAADATSTTKKLEEKLKDSDVKIIITTIQKLSTYLKRIISTKNNLQERPKILDQNVVLIFDEAHRSQFGDMHKIIANSFSKYCLFGFTGTPIFATNSTVSTTEANIKTTTDLFGERIHTYTIKDAIHDQTVLPFLVDHVKTFKVREKIEDLKVADIERSPVFESQQRISKITSYILKDFNNKTMRNQKVYDHTRTIITKDFITGKETTEKKELVRISGFNSLLAVSSIKAAKIYYEEFKKQQASLPENRRLKVGMIYSFDPNQNLANYSIDGLNDEDNEVTTKLDASDRVALDQAINDYNQMFHTQYSTKDDGFSNYYKDVSLRVKNKELDILIVVNMFLTGFDAKTLNTLWIDRFVKYHGLIQAFSRTNRIFNAIKPAGNIVCFVNLEDQIISAVNLFGDADSNGVIILRPFNDYYNGYDDEKGNHKLGYTELVNELLTKFSLLNFPLVSESLEREFVILMNNLLKMANVIKCFSEFGDQPEILSEAKFEDYRGRYLELREKYKKTREAKAVSILEDLEFEVELVKQTEVNIDYILKIIASFDPSKIGNKELLIQLTKAINASPSLRSKKELILEFAGRVNPGDEISEDSWNYFVIDKKKEELDHLINEEKLDPQKTDRYIHDAFIKGYITDEGEDFYELIPKLDLFSPVSQQKRKEIFEKIKDFFERYLNL